MSHDEQRLDAIVWSRIEKRFRECTTDEIDSVLALISAETAEHRRRVLKATLQIAAQQAVIDQYDAAVADGIRQAERWANGGAS